MTFYLHNSTPYFRKLIGVRFSYQKFLTKLLMNTELPEFELDYLIASGLRMLFENFKI